jgi:Protein of unknown function (DUF1003)
MSTGGATAQQHPVVVAELERRAASAQLRLADRITAFAGSMTFVYIHAGLFGVWMLVFEHSPWPTLTLIVSLEAIFLSTFVMIGQNRQAAFAAAKASTISSSRNSSSRRTRSSRARSTCSRPSCTAASWGISRSLSRGLQLHSRPVRRPGNGQDQLRVSVNVDSMESSSPLLA